MKAKNSKNIKITILVITYLIILFFQTVVFVPYKRTKTFISSQNVPHTVTVGKGFDYIDYIGYSQKETINGKLCLSVETVDYPILILGLLLSTGFTTLIAIYIFHKYDKKKTMLQIWKSLEPPTLDINDLAFADSDTQNAEMARYEKELRTYLKYKMLIESK